MSNFLIIYPPIGPIIIAPKNIGIEEPIMIPTVLCTNYTTSCIIYKYTTLKSD